MARKDRAATVHRPPAWLRTVNRILGGPARLGVVPPLGDAPSLIAAAQGKAGLDDFGDAGFRAGLETLLRSLEREVRPTPIGRLVLRDTLMGYLVNRLRIVDSVRGDPTIADLPVSRPLFIVGLSRTGTTLLHNLLALAPESRAPRTWELLTPAPPCEPGESCARRRVARTRRQLRMLYAAAPALRVVHPIDALDAEECYPLLNHTFVSPAFGMHYGVPSYWEWVTRQRERTRRAYAEYRTQLQILQHRHPPQRWVLKSAAHLPGLASLLEVFPDAMIVQTYRDLRETLPSLCSMVACMRNLVLPERPPAALGRECLERANTVLRAGLAARDGRPPEQFLEVAYDELTRDPLGQVARVHRHFGLDFSPAHQDAARRWLEAHPPHRHGIHRYSMTQFGLDDDAITKTLGPSGHGLS
jgi:hypothetical protein